MKKKADSIETSLLIFEEFAKIHGESSEHGDHKIANEAYKEINKAVSFLKKNNEIYRLNIFLDHESFGVRLWAATYLLPIEELMAKNVLDAIVRRGGILAFTAKNTLAEWRKGTLKL